MNGQMSKSQLAVYKLACAMHDAGLIMSASKLAGVLNDSKVTDGDVGYSEDPKHSRGIHKLVATTWQRVHDHISSHDAEKIAKVFTSKYGTTPWFDGDV